MHKEAMHHKDEARGRDGKASGTNYGRTKESKRGKNPPGNAGGGYDAGMFLCFSLPLIGGGDAG